MGKKKKSSHIKLNNRIRAFFSGLPFDEGVTTLNSEQLKGLMLLLEIDPRHMNKEEMIRALRRIWSNAEFKSRSSIVSFLTDKKVLSSDIDKSNASQKAASILDILSTIEHTKEEERNVLESFLDTSSHKITPEKIRNKIFYNRQKAYLQKIEDILKVHFDNMGRMEFHYSFHFEIKEKEFNKILTCISKPIDFELTEENLSSTIDDLKAQKENIIKTKQEEINSFLHLIMHRKNPYLQTEEIIESIKNMPPDGSLEHAPIAFEMVEKIIQDINKKYYLTQSSDDFIIEKEARYTYCQTDFRYNISVTYSKKLLYSMILKGEKLYIQEEFDSLKDRLIEDFNIQIKDLKDEMNSYATGLKIQDDFISDFLLDFLIAQVENSRNLKIKEKTRRKIIYHWLEYIKPYLEKYKQEQLLAKSIRDFKLLFPLARSLKRKIIFNAGPTNSGKTHNALNILANATTGTYLAPLRLLALEGYENLTKLNVTASLITGEEEIINEDSTHISSTIEMMNSQVAVDVCVIDEIQMINDRDRGWAWANALIGIPARTIILTGSSDAIKAIEKLSNYLEEELEIVHFERKNELEVLSRPTSINKIEKQSAIVAFSRKDVLALKQQLSSKYTVSVVYGNLSPEVRREEARRFREGESEILVATDAIAMGLNLPIKTILFAKDNKFDGVHRRELETSEILQISGRAGRYGFEEKGYVGALDSNILDTIKKSFYTPLKDIELPVSVMASFEHVMLIGDILQTDNLVDILDFFAQNMEFEGPFRAANIDSMIEISGIVDEYKLDLKTKYYFACAPAGLSSPYIESVLHRYIRLIESGKKVNYNPPKDLPKFAQTNEMLLNAEDRVREISLYLWLSFRFPYFFEDTEIAIKSRVRLNNFIENSLKHGYFVKECHRCGKVLDFSYRYSICEECHSKGRRGTRFATHKNKEKLKSK